MGMLKKLEAVVGSWVTGMVDDGKGGVWVEGKVSWPNLLFCVDCRAPWELLAEEADGPDLVGQGPQNRRDLDESRNLSTSLPRKAVRKCQVARLRAAPTYHVSSITAGGVQQDCIRRIRNRKWSR